MALVNTIKYVVRFVLKYFFVLLFFQKRHPSFFIHARIVPLPHTNLLSRQPSGTAKLSTLFGRDLRSRWMLLHLLFEKAPLLWAKYTIVTPHMKNQTLHLDRLNQNNRISGSAHFAYLTLSCRCFKQHKKKIF